MTKKPKETQPNQAGLKAWLKRGAKLGFWFFFIKGLLWLTIPLVLLLFGFECRTK